MSGTLRYMCRFCQTATVHIGHYETAQVQAALKQVEWYKCHKCNIVYSVAGNGELLEMALNCIIDDKEYQYQINYDTNSSRIVLFPKNANDTIIIVADIEGTPVFKKKPKDLEHKIRTYITFS